MDEIYMYIFWRMEFRFYVMAACYLLLLRRIFQITTTSTIYKVLEFQSCSDGMLIKTGPIVAWHVHGTVLSVEVRRNERLTWVVVADSRHWWYVWANFWLQKFAVIISLRNKLIRKDCSRLSIFLCWKNVHRLVLLQDQHKIPQVIGYGRLYYTLIRALKFVLAKH